MKTTTLIFILLTLLTISPLSAEIEIEEVVKLYGEDSFTDRPRIFTKGDSIVAIARTVLKNENIRKSHIFFSTDGGNSWEVITNRFENKEYDNSLINEYFNESNFKFITRTKDENDTTLFYVDFDGEIVRSIKYPNIDDNHRIIFHPTDPSILVFHVLTNDQHHRIFSHQFIYSTNYGETWKYALPYEKVREKYGEDISVFWSVNYKFNLRNPEKTILEYEWQNIFGPYFGINIMLNMYDDSMEIIEGLIPSSICFGCIEEDELLYKTSKSDSLIRYNIYTKSKQDYSRMEQTLHFNIDSVEMNNTDNYEQNFDFKKLEYNSKNPNHQLLLIEHKEFDRDKTPKYSFINQYLFQTFDAGFTWELVLTNFDKFNIILDYQINSEDLSFWVIKGESIVPRPNPSNSKASIYRSKSPLTNINVNNESKNFSAHFNKNLLHIDSDDYYTNSSISVFDLTGKQIFNDVVDIYKGENQITIDYNFNTGLYLVNVKGERLYNQVFKLLRVE